MAEEGIERTNGRPIVGNIECQNADSRRNNAPIIQRKANNASDAMDGLLTQAQQPRARVRGCRHQGGRYQLNRHEKGAQQS